jgi:hypothetical protein
MAYNGHEARQNLDKNRLHGPPDTGGLGIVERDWLHFLWLFHCVSIAASRDFLYQAGYRPSAVKQFAAYAKELPEDMRKRLAAEIARRIMENDRSLDPPGHRSDTGGRDPYARRRQE